MRSARRILLPVVVAAATVLSACSVDELGIQVDPVELTTTTTAAPVISSDTIRLNGEKPVQPYDTYISLVVDDLQRFWGEAFPLIAGGEAYVPLEGGVWPVWPDADGVPGCATRSTTYRDVEQNAFYCFDDDFIAYDDGPGGLFSSLYEGFGSVVVGVVMAHEWGHAIQQRRGYQMAPVTYEIQADCFAGAWVAHVRSGEASGDLSVSDPELRAALSGMMQFRDAVGDTPDLPGAHGSAFDRVSAFQDGLDGGVEACEAYATTPPAVLQLPFGSVQDQANEGNLPYDELLVVDPSDDEPDPADPDDFPNISLPESLDLFYGEQVARVGGDFEPLAPDMVIDASGADLDCEGASDQQAENGVVACTDPRQVVLDEDRTRQLHADIGDFALGILLGDAWAAEAQRGLGIDPQDEGAETQRDCLQGVYVASIFPTGDAPFVISPGDLDESVSTFLLLTDQSGDDAADLALSRIAAFRLGLLTALDEGADAGVDRCLA